jgi:heptosyltransferase-1
MRVLIVRVGAMGDVLHALPAVAALRKERPEWTIDWVVDERWAPLLEANGFGGPVVNVAFRVAIREWKRRPFALKTARELLEFRSLRGSYDCVVDMQGTLRSSAIGWLAGGRTLTGYADPRERLAARLYGTKVQRTGQHVVEQGAALLSAACGAELEPVAPELPKEEWAEAWAEELVSSDRVCVLAPGAGWGAKRWPAANFGALAATMRAQGFRVMVNASRKDDALAAQVVAASSGAGELAVCNVTGLVALLRRAAVVVGNDSGPMHLAATLGVPVVALFGPTDPARNGPWGAGRWAVVRDAASKTSYKRSDAVDVGLARVTGETVIEAVKGVVIESR